MTASAVSVIGLTNNVALIDLYLGIVTHMTVLTTTIDRTIEGRTSVIGIAYLCGITDIDDRLVDIA